MITVILIILTSLLEPELTGPDFPADTYLLPVFGKQELKIHSYHDVVVYPCRGDIKILNYDHADKDH